MSLKKFKRVALVHDWLFHMRGGEKVLEALAELFPDAEIHTLFLDKKGLSDSLNQHTIKPSFLNGLPGIHKRYKWLLPLLPWVIERIDLKGYDLVISSSHCVAKGVKPAKGVPHICYCHTPVRYAWYFGREYFAKYPPLLRGLIQKNLESLRRWDKTSSNRVTHFIANSHNIARKIQEAYGREAHVIHPPLEWSRFKIAKTKKEFYLVVSALVPYKRIDIVVKAFNQLGKSLVVIGKGEEAERLKSKAGSNISFLDWVSDEDLRRYYSEAKALLFPGEEDFGIVPLEAEASGTPVIAYAKGGALETVEEGITGIFFEKQTSGALIEAIEQFESKEWDPQMIRAWTKKFSKKHFQEAVLSYLETVL